MFQVQKPKSASKIMISNQKLLHPAVVGTLGEIAQLVGATLGPGGKQVLIERPEIGLKPIMTKDGVTVIKHMGYEDSIKQLILESVRDASVRTASEAGDGTTTATILSHAIAKYMSEALYSNSNHNISPQQIVREITALVPTIEEFVATQRIEADSEGVLLKVAELSANGDTELAKVIINALNTVGDEGNITIVETSGPTGYKIEKLHGYTVEQGHEMSCRNLAQGFFNDKSGTKIIMDMPFIILYDGMLHDITQVFEALNQLNTIIHQKGIPILHVALVAHGFSDSVIGDFHVNWNHEQTKIKVLPVLTQDSLTKSSKTQQLYDLQAYCGTPVFNPIDKPLVDANFETLLEKNRATFLECDRFKTIITAKEDLFAINIRVDELKERLKNPESEYEVHEIKTRIGKLNAGIARLNISAPSQGETREKRDRAEDAWMAIKGAITHGAVPGGGYILSKLSVLFNEMVAETPAKKIAQNILSVALPEPVNRLYENYGYSVSETEAIIERLIKDDVVFDILTQTYKPKHELLDSAPAILEAIKNSISIASLLGSLGGVIAFKRDHASDKDEEKLVRNFESSGGLRGSLDA